MNLKSMVRYIKPTLLILLCLFYCTFTVSILWDTAHYMSYVSIFEGVLGWNTWDIVRGPTFPLIIFFSNIFFGKTVQGLIILTGIFYSITLYFVYKILKSFLKEKKQKEKNIIIAMVIILIIMNPIIFGYYHTLLTEFVAMTVAITMCYISWKWISVIFEKINWKYIFYTIGFTLTIIFTYFLKQPYLSTSIFPIIVAYIISIFQNKNLKDSIYKGLTILFSIIVLFVSINIWTNFLAEKGVVVSSDRNVVEGFGSSLIGGINNLKLNEDIIDDQYINNDSMLNRKEKEKLLNDFDNYYLYNVTYKDKVIDKIVIGKIGKVIPVSSAIITITKNIFQHPIVLLESYYSNYMALANLYPKSTLDGVGYTVIKKLSLTYCHENCTIAERLSDYNQSVFYMTDEMYSRVADYDQANNSPKIFRGILKVIKPIYNYLYSFAIIFLPIILIGSIVLRLALKKKKDLLNITIILLGFSFLHLMIHVATGAAIDRYASPTLIPIYLGIILLVSLVFKEKKLIRKR